VPSQCAARWPLQGVAQVLLQRVEGRHERGEDRDEHHDDDEAECHERRPSLHEAAPEPSERCLDHVARGGGGFPSLELVPRVDVFVRHLVDRGSWRSSVVVSVSANGGWGSMSLTPTSPSG
jgi:hypothetical protein